MGIAVKDLNVPVMKGTSGILVLRKEETGKEEVMPCIYCGKCVYVCPMRLLPVFMAAYVERGFMEEAEKARVMDCCECGSCAYQCPSKRPLTQLIRLGKAGSWKNAGLWQKPVRSRSSREEDLRDR